MGNTPSSHEGASGQRSGKRASAPRASTDSDASRSGLAPSAAGNVAPDATVTVHRPGHLYSHSINLPAHVAATSDDEDLASIRRHPYSSWDHGEHPGVVLSGMPYARGPPSDSSMRRSQSSLTDSSTQRSDSTYWGSNSDVFDSDAEHRDPPRTAAHAPYRFPPIQTDAAHQDVEVALKTPTQPPNELQPPNTPRSGNTGLHDLQRTPVSRNEGLAGSRVHIPHRASLIISEEAAPTPHDIPSSPVLDHQARAGDTESRASRRDGRRLRALPSYLRIPTSIPREFASTAPSTAADDAPASDAGAHKTLDILHMPMYSGSTTERSDVTVAAPAHEVSTVARSGISRTRTEPLLLASPRVSEPASAEPPEPASVTAATPAEPVEAAAPPTHAATAGPAAVGSAPADDKPRLTPVNLMWRGKGRQVYVTGTFADQWRSKIPLRQLRPNTPFLCTLYLPPGTHRLKFVVDDRWRISNELNTASDGEGTLVNYVEIPHTRERLSDGSSLAPHKQGDAELRPADDPRFADPAWASAMDDLRRQHRASLEQRSGEWDELGDEAHGADVAHWTTDVPPAVEVAQETEEALHEHEMDSNAAALLPMPPQLPRQLEKVILNSSPAHAISSINTTAAVVDDNSVLPAPNHAVLHHLAASAIKNGVLAIGTVTRYKRKYVTTLLYRPVA
ncbi:hypothetical protein MBRA1_003015 [Malassezia brasiliensis]|uniref:Association with the SNF1 complex (ASC) domain-containing protein n=1 Tax=Malassezia brasiliensis TaxID=1821822 RepID=A0AAF0DUI2_9BASI|nr:hypothetical protein MBRA1_003015 [Malassezia brasiliensis]